MKLRQLLAIEAILGKTIPKDVLNEDVKYYSESKSSWIPILDMDIIHLTRVAKKNLDANDKLYLQSDEKDDNIEVNNKEKEVYSNEEWTRWALDNIS